MASLYLSMTAKLSEHWRTNDNVYPQKFILTPAQRAEYDDSRRMCSAPPDTIDNPKHMGVPIQISDTTPGVMVAANGTEVSLISTSEA